MKNIQGGAIVVVCRKASGSPLPEYIRSLIQKEVEAGVTTLEGMQRFGTQLNKKLFDFRSDFAPLLAEKKIVGYGAAVSAPLIIDLLSIGSYLEYVVDDNPYKIGKYLPIRNLKVVSSSEITCDPHGIVFVILGWAQTERILIRLTEKFPGSIAITIFPKYSIVHI